MFKLSIFSELRITGHDAELCNFDNPNGEIITEVFLIRAERPDGKRLCFKDYFWSADAAFSAWETGCVVFNPNSEDWYEIPPCYGSDYYQKHCVNNDDNQLSLWPKA